MSEIRKVRARRPQLKPQISPEQVKAFISAGIEASKRRHQISPPSYPAVLG